jgi:very-short-patch-repair endonuclease/AraC-like DNA-binding protein
MTPSKENLINDYFVLNLSQQEIAEKYGYKTRQVISRLFKKFEIEPKDKSQLAKERAEKKKPSREELVELYQNNSISEMAKKLNLSRKFLTSLMKEYEIDTTYFKYFIDDIQLHEDLKTLSLKEIELKHNYPVQELKRRKLTKIELPKVSYSVERIKQIMSLYDLNNQGFTKQIINDDPNVYDSIIEHTKSHKTQSDKITEKVYRLINDYDADYIPVCKQTGEVLKFYTMEKGYGNSELNLSRKGFYESYDFSCHSNISQKLFWEIHKNLTKEQKEKVEFAQLNSERKIKTDGTKEKLNKHYFSLDFCLENKNIEFDGEYWHSFPEIQEKDKVRDEFLTSMGYMILRIKERDYYNNPEEVLNKCIRFLTS